MKRLPLLLILLLPSCAFLEDLNFTGSVAYISDDGAKARIISDGTDTTIEGWKKIGDSWVRVGTTIKPQVEVEK